MRSFIIKLLFIALACGVTPQVFADDNEDQAYQEAERQQRSEQQYWDIHDTIVPIVSLLFNKNKPQTDVYWSTPPQGYYYGPALRNANIKMLPPGRCFQQTNGGPIREIPCY